MHEFSKQKISRQKFHRNYIYKNIVHESGYSKKRILRVIILGYYQKNLPNEHDNQTKTQKFVLWVRTVSKLVQEILSFFLSSIFEDDSDSL